MIVSDIYFKDCFLCGNCIFCPTYPSLTYPNLIMHVVAGYRPPPVPLPAYQRPLEPVVNYDHSLPVQPQHPYSKSNWQENEKPQDYQNQYQQDNRWEYGGPKNPHRTNNQFEGLQDPYHKNNRQEYVRANEPQDAYYNDGQRGYTRPGDAGNGSSVNPWEPVRSAVDEMPRPRKQVNRSASHVRRQDEPQITAQTRAWVVDQAGGRDQRTCVEMLKKERQNLGRNNGVPGERQGNRPVDYARNGHKYEDRSGPNQNMNNTRMGDRMDHRNPVPYTSDPRPAPYMDRAKQGYYEGQDRFQQYPPEPRPTQNINAGRPVQYGDPRPMHNGVPRPALYREEPKPAPNREEPRPAQYGQPKNVQYIEGPIVSQYGDPRNGQYIDQLRPAHYPGEPRPAQLRGELTHGHYIGEPRAAPYPGEPKQAQYIEKPRPVQYREPRAAQYIQEPRPAPYLGDPRANRNMEQDRHVPYGRPSVY